MDDICGILRTRRNADDLSTRRGKSSDAGRGGVAANQTFSRVSVLA